MHCKSNYRNSIAFIALYLFFISTIIGQTTGDIYDYSAAKDYEIGGIKITGVKYSDENAVISMTGLKVGDKIKIPGADIPNAIKSLTKLRLFTNIEIAEEKRIGDIIFLNIEVEELARFSRHSIHGVKKKYHDDLNSIINKHLLKGGIITKNIKSNVSNELRQFFINKGFMDASVSVFEMKDERSKNDVRLEFEIDKKQRIKIQDITFVGNTKIPSKKLLRKMKDTRRRRRIFSASKFIQQDYDDNCASLISHYNNIGFKDASVLSDSVWRTDKGHLMLQLNIHEGNQYYFGDISWKGNSIYDTKTLEEVLGIKKGDIYNEELFEKRLRFSQDGRDISTLYMDNGHLFFQVDPVETSMEGDTIDMEIRIMEGPEATINKVIITGNDRTNEEVIRRELRTLPGKKFSRSDIIRSQREIVNLGYFNPETLGINTPVDSQNGTVDIEYQVEEKSSDQLELSAGWGGQDRGVVGTVGISFNNFSVRNFFKKESWQPLPQGDGQRLSLRAQSNGSAFQSYNVSFTEPWLGKKKANSFSVGGYHTRMQTGVNGTSSYGTLGISALTVGLGSRLKFPDNNFISNTTLNIQNINLNNWASGVFLDEAGNTVSSGKFNNLSIKQTFTRTTVDNPIFPRSGSSFSLSGQFTLPYSLLNKKSYYDVSLQDKHRWLEYHKWRFSAQWYTPLVGNLILKTSAKIGLIGSYNKKLGLSPFEKYVFGGDGLSNQSSGLLGYDVISMRGYDVDDFDASDGGAAAFSKFSVELRHPITLNPNATVYGLVFAEAGNAWNSIGDVNPFDMKRSVGVGLRAHVPMFGTLGFDYGIGFDKPGIQALGNSGWSQFGKFSIILGLEPE